MIGLLIWLLVLLLVMYVGKLIVEAMELPENIKKIVFLILGVIFVLLLLGQLGVLGPQYTVYSIR